MQNYYDEINEKIKDFELSCEVKESVIYIQQLQAHLRVYLDYLDYLETTKPLFFQKEKLNIHNKKIMECQNHINYIYKKISNEIALSNEKIKNIQQDN